MVNIKGFHGTLEQRANKILKEGFIHSHKNREWLGSGIYFFSKFNDAEKWAIMEANKPQNKGSKAVVLTTDIIVNPNNFFDFDIPDNMEKFYNETKTLVNGIKDKIHGKNQDAQIRHALCEWFAKKYKIDVYAYTFPLHIYINPVGFPDVQSQRQICVKKDICITNLYKCDKGGISL